MRREREITLVAFFFSFHTGKTVSEDVTDLTESLVS